MTAGRKGNFLVCAGESNGYATKSGEKKEHF